MLAGCFGAEYKIVTLHMDTVEGGDDYGKNSKCVCSS